MTFEREAPESLRLRAGEINLFKELSAHLRAPRETTQNALPFGFGDFLSSCSNSKTTYGDYFNIRVFFLLSTCRWHVILHFFACNNIDFGNMIREKLHPIWHVILLFWETCRWHVILHFFACNNIDFGNMVRGKLHPISDVILLFWETCRSDVILHFSDVIMAIFHFSCEISRLDDTFYNTSGDPKKRRRRKFLQETRFSMFF